MDVELGDRAAEGDAGDAADVPPSPPPPRRARFWHAAPQRAANADVRGAAPAADDELSTDSSSRESAGPSRSMRVLKACTLLLLLTVAGVGGGVAYKLGHDSEVRTFELQFSASAEQLHVNMQNRLLILMRSAVMGAKYIASLPDRGEGRGAYIPGFMAFGEDMLAVTHASVASWLTIVTDAERAGFESHAAAAALRLDPNGTLAAQVARDGIRGRAPGDPKPGATAGFVRAPPAPLYVPTWANAPRTLPRLNDFFLFNAFEEPVRKAALQLSMDTGLLSLTDMTRFTFADPPGTNTPSSVLLAPAWPHLRTNDSYNVAMNFNAEGLLLTDTDAQTGRAFCAIAFHWTSILDDSLPRFIDAIVAVLRSPGGATHTFTVSGNAVVSAGDGDRSGSLARGFADHGRRLELDIAGGEWSVTLYPTRTLQRQYITHKPRDNALGLAGAVLAVALLFAWYEFFDRRRAQRVRARLLAYVRQQEQLQRELTQGYAREAEAKARVLAEEASSRAKDQFVSMVSHEVRTPLNAVAGATALLAGTRLDAEQRDLVALLEAGTAHVVLIVEDILLHGALVSGAFSVATERVDLARAVLEPSWRMVAMQKAQRAKLAALRMTRALSPEVPRVITGDATRLTQVLANLLSNAVKFTPEGGAVHLQVDVTDEAPESTAHSHAEPGAAAVVAPPPMPPPPPVADGAISGRQPRRWLRFSVRDTGIGVDPANLHRIMLPFVQAEQSTVRQFGGTGLGLTICRRIARAMGGELVADSEGLGKGMTLTFTIPLVTPADDAGGASGSGVADDVALPLVPAEDESPPRRPGSAAGAPSELTPPPPPPRSPSGSPRSTMRVLVAEDDALSQAVMRKILARLRIEHTIVANGLLAVEAFQRESYDLALMDLHMPVMDGLESARSICAIAARGERPAMPIVALTASCSDEERRRCADAGMVDLLPKPIRIDTLKAVLKLYARRTVPQASPSPLGAAAAAQEGAPTAHGEAAGCSQVAAPSGSPAARRALDL